VSTGTVVLLVVLVAASVLLWRYGRRMEAVAAAAMALVPGSVVVQAVSWPLVAAMAALVLAVLLVRRSRTSALVARWGARSRRKDGVASTADIVRVGSALAMRRKAATVRPSLATSSRWARWVQLWRLPTAQVGVLLCRVGWWRVWASVEDVTLTFGGPRTGKTQWLAGRVIDGPGAALVTSTRTDLYEQTAPLRAGVGPVFVFNAVGLGGIASTITFDPLTGCTDPTTAAERASDLLGGASKGGGGDREYWDAQARRVLTALLHAAALDGELDMHTVQRWVTDPDGARRQVTSLLRRSAAVGFVQDATQFVTTNDKTRSSITSTIMPALEWLNSPAACKAAAGGVGFDVAELLGSRATVYLLGAEETQAAPLVCALTGHIAREARRIAATCKGGRLDPPLGLYLDEAALICPVPLHRWTADMGGRNVTIVAAFQSRAQMLDRYGEANAAVIINNAAARLLFGGTGDRDDLNYWSTLAGERDEPVLTTDLHGRVTSRSVRRVPVLAPAQLANLPAGRVVVWRRGMAPVVGRAEMAWRRRDVRIHHHGPDVRARLWAPIGRVRAGRPWREELASLFARARKALPTPTTTDVADAAGGGLDSPWATPWRPGDTDWPGAQQPAANGDSNGASNGASGGAVNGSGRWN